MLQPYEELENWHKTRDPWEYEKTEDDKRRKDILLSEIPKKDYKNVIDIGCGQGFIARELPGQKVIGVDISAEAIKHAKKHESERLTFLQASLFDLPKKINEKFDLVCITGVLYPQYIGKSLNLVYIIIDRLLKEGGILATVHIDEWYNAKFPYLMLNDYYYAYRDYTHKLEVYIK
jgi:predicted TPR repeat methyltransferase